MQINVINVAIIYVHVRKDGPSSVSAFEKCRGVGCFNTVEEDIADVIGNQEEDHNDEDRNLFDDLFL